MDFDPEKIMDDLTFSQPISEQRGSELQENMLKTLIDEVKSLREEILQLKGLVRKLEKTEVTKTVCGTSRSTNGRLRRKL